MNGLLEIYKTLLQAYGQRLWWPAETPFEMMVGAILTQNTNWTNVEKALRSLGEQLSPEFIAWVSTEELALLIRASGYHNQKAIHLKALNHWFARYSYDVNEAMQRDGEFLRRELLEVKGVGPETADSILLYALNKPFFVVDNYTQRLLLRQGYHIPYTYEGLRRKIEESLPQDIDIYKEFHALIVEHGKRHCKKTPSCAACPVEARCKNHII